MLAIPLTVDELNTIQNGVRQWDTLQAGQFPAIQTYSFLSLSVCPGFLLACVGQTR